MHLHPSRNYVAFSQYFKRLRTTDSKEVATYVDLFLNNEKFNLLFRSVVDQIKNTLQPGERNIAYLFNGRFFMYYVILHALKELRIPTIIHERGGIKKSTALSLNVGFGNNNKLYRSFNLDYCNSITQNDINRIYNYQVTRCYKGEVNNFSTVCTIDNSNTTIPLKLMFSAVLNLFVTLQVVQRNTLLMTRIVHMKVS